MQYINPYELLNVENKIPQNILDIQQNKEMRKAELARTTVGGYIKNGINDIKVMLYVKGRYLDKWVEWTNRIRHC